MDTGVPSKSFVNVRMTVIFPENMIGLSLWLVINIKNEVYMASQNFLGNPW